MITVGLDFGTHQTKVCVETKEGVELNYRFLLFNDDENRSFYTIPSIIGIGDDGLLSYGYLPKKYDGRVIRYFKQSAFYPTDSGMSNKDAMYYSTWFISYILFDLEELYGKNFSIQMGAPTDSSHVNEAKQIATRIIASAYRLVEDIFENNKDAFLSTPISQLLEITEIIEYSDEIKDEYVLLVFPEAYACLKPLISQRKIDIGMSLMIDIGGGTTDISFFTIENNMPQVYDFFSINKGLNYLTCAEEKERKGYIVESESEIDNSRKEIFTHEINGICKTINKSLYSELKKQTKIRASILYKALQDRPIVYCGGGSTFPTLRVEYDGYKNVKLISSTEWNSKCVSQIEDIVAKNLCPILSTAYGLSISTEHDNIQMKPLRDIFESVRSNEDEPVNSRFGQAYGGFSYDDDRDAWK